MLYELAEWTYRWGLALPSPGWFLLGLFVLGLPTIVIHELGHAVAAGLIAKAPVKIEIRFVGDWMGLCRVDDGSRVTVGGFMVIIVAGPLASLIQAAVCIWLTGMASRGTLSHGVLAIMATQGLIAGVCNLVPFHHGALRSDGQQLLDMARLVLTGRVPAYAQPEDPHVATSVAPPGSPGR